MELVVDLERVTVVLGEPEDTRRFAVRVGAPKGASPAAEADVHRLGDVLVAANVGRLDATGDAFIRPDAVRFHAAGQVGDDWEQRFAAMCAFAAERGWLDPADGAIQAHVEWPDAGN